MLGKLRYFGKDRDEALNIWLEQKDLASLYHDFRGRPLPTELELFQVDDPSFGKHEAAGLRITIPMIYDDQSYNDQSYKHGPNGVGCQTTAPLCGDFDVTATVELLGDEHPAAGGGAGVGLSVAAGDSGVQMRRLIGANGNETLLSSQYYPVPGKKAPVWVRHPTPCGERSVRLRLKRIGEIVHCLWAPAAGGDNLDEIDQFKLGSQDINRVRMFAQVLIYQAAYQQAKRAMQRMQRDFASQFGIGSKT